LDKFIVFGKRHLDYPIAEFTSYYNHQRSHMERDRLPPIREVPEEIGTLTPDQIEMKSYVGGLVTSFERKSAWGRMSELQDIAPPIAEQNGKLACMLVDFNVQRGRGPVKKIGGSHCNEIGEPLLSGKNVSFINVERDEQKFTKPTRMFYV